MFWTDSFFSSSPPTPASFAPFFTHTSASPSATICSSGSRGRPDLSARARSRAPGTRDLCAAPPPPPPPPPLAAPAAKLALRSTCRDRERGSERLRAMAAAALAAADPRGGAARRVASSRGCGVC